MTSSGPPCAFTAVKKVRFIPPSLTVVSGAVGTPRIMSFVVSMSSRRCLSRYSRDDVLRDAVGGAAPRREAVSLGFEVCDLEMIVAILDHFPECHVRRVAMARHVERCHAEWIGLQLERFLASKERFAGERVDLRDLLVGHGIAAGRRAAAMDHQERAGAAVRPVVGVGEAGI